MHRLPGAIVVVDTNREKNALLEAKNLGIPTICLIDTDGDPELADIPIPGNDDSMRSIDVVIRELCAAVSEGLGHRQTNDAVSAKREGRDGGEGDAGDGQQRRRSSRSRFRSDSAGDAGAEVTASAE
jgi:small subunit ribosomal protein S2